MSQHPPQLIVALDVDTLDKAAGLVRQLGGEVEIYKVGSQLFTACGPEIVHYLLQRDKKVFLDLKFYDIPNTAANAVSAAIGLRQGDKSVFMCTLHIEGGREMLQRAAASAAKTAQNIGVTRPLLIGITVLTSEAKKDNIHQLVLERSDLARQAGLDGVVASVHEARAIRERLGNKFVIVTPGIRPRGSRTGDQKRTATVEEAVSNGSDFLVIGRPIVEADSPIEAVQQILREIQPK